MDEGTRLGHYVIREPLGVGGMGEVYRAADTTLDRDVAIKVLPQEFAVHPDRLRRFEREAKLLASLSHANIAAIHGLQEADGIRFIVMECVEGQSLDERLAAGGRLEVGQVLEIGRRVAEALEAAHAKGIVHRDLKPANVMLTPDHDVKVLDFGLAKAYELDELSDGARTSIEAPDQTRSPTILATTQRGVIAGTASYMSPEQARGQAVDKRSDVWSFGCLLYELLSGRKAFAGDTASDTIAHILKDAPDLERLPPNTPSAVVRLIRRCLAKNARQRLHDIADARIVITDAIERGPVERELGEARPIIGGSRAPVAAAAIAGIVLGFVVATTWWRVGEGDDDGVGLAHLGIPLTPDQPLALSGQVHTAIALSRDGRQLAFVVGSAGDVSLYRKDVREREPVHVAGTEGAQGPVFTPDGTALAFFADGKLKRVELTGGAVSDMATVSLVRGLAFLDDERFVYTPTLNSGLSIGGAGIESEVLTEVDNAAGEFGHRWPATIRGHDALLFVVDTGGSFDDARIGYLDLNTGERKIVLDGGTRPVYSPTGHVLFARDNRLLAAPFDAATGELTGPPAVILDGVLTQSDTGAAHYVLSDNAVLAYIPSDAWTPEREMVTLAADGTATPIDRLPVHRYQQPALSPDGNLLAINIVEDRHDIWVADLRRGGILTRVTFAGDNHAPVWSPDGRQLIFSSERGRPAQVYMKSADRSGEAEQLWESTTANVPTSLSSDGRFLAFTEVNPGTRGDVWILDMEDRTATALLETSADERAAMFSPRDPLLAYVSTESGRSEIYLRAYPDPGRTLQVSNAGGSQPRWSRDGRTLYYLQRDAMMAVRIDVHPLDTGVPQELFRAPIEAGYVHHPTAYEVTDDGSFYTSRSLPTTETPRIDVVLGVGELLRPLTPVQR